MGVVDSAYLKSGVNGEGPRSRVHASHILAVVHILQCQFLPIIPVSGENGVSIYHRLGKPSCKSPGMCLGKTA